nr:MAG: hypothetical protein [Halyomorpha halys reo-like associated virus 1]
MSDIYLVGSVIFYDARNVLTSKIDDSLKTIFEKVYAIGEGFTKLDDKTASTRIRDAFPGNNDNRSADSKELIAQEYFKTVFIDLVNLDGMKDEVITLSDFTNATDPGKKWNYTHQLTRAMVQELKQSISVYYMNETYKTSNVTVHLWTANFYPSNAFINKADVPENLVSEGDSKNTDEVNANTFILNSSVASARSCSFVDIVQLPSYVNRLDQSHVTAVLNKIRISGTENKYNEFESQNILANADLLSLTKISNKSNNDKLLVLQKERNHNNMDAGMDNVVFILFDKDINSLVTAHPDEFVQFKDDGGHKASNNTHGMRICLSSDAKIFNKKDIKLLGVVLYDNINIVKNHAKSLNLDKELSSIEKKYSDIINSFKGEKVFINSSEELYDGVKHLADSVNEKHVKNSGNKVSAIGIPPGPGRMALMKRLSAHASGYVDIESVIPIGKRKADEYIKSVSDLLSKGVHNVITEGILLVHVKGEVLNSKMAYVGTVLIGSDDNVNITPEWLKIVSRDKSAKYRYLDDKSASALIIANINKNVHNNNSGLSEALNKASLEKNKHSSK